MRTISGELCRSEGSWHFRPHGYSTWFSGVGLTKYGFALITTCLMITGIDFVLVMLIFQN